MLNTFRLSNYINTLQKCLQISGTTEVMYGYTKDALVRIGRFYYVVTEVTDDTRPESDGIIKLAYLHPLETIESAKHLGDNEWRVFGPDKKVYHLNARTEECIQESNMMFNGSTFVTR